MRTSDNQPSSIPSPSQPIISQELINRFVTEVSKEKGWSPEQTSRFRTLLPSVDHRYRDPAEK